uniref:hypothetical protein n=1 Tax=Enterococcus sp. TaxID=35783 RepID=UPI0028ACCB5B
MPRMTRKKMMTLGITVLTLQSSLLPAGMVYAETKEAQNEHQEYGYDQVEQYSEEFLANNQTNILEYTESRNTNAVPIKDYEGTAFMNDGNLSEKALDMISSSGAIPISTTEKTQILFNGLPVNEGQKVFDYLRGDFDKPIEVIYTYVGTHRGQPIEAKISINNISSLTNGRMILYWHQEEASIVTRSISSFDVQYEFRLMDTKEIITNNVILGVRPTGNVIDSFHTGLKNEFSTNNLKGLIIDEGYKGASQVSKSDNDLHVDYGNSSEVNQLLGLDTEQSTIFHILETGSFDKKVTIGSPDAGLHHSSMTILNWPGDESIIRGNLQETTISNLNTDSIKVTGTA